MTTYNIYFDESRILQIRRSLILLLVRFKDLGKKASYCRSFAWPDEQAWY